MSYLFLIIDIVLLAAVGIFSFNKKVNFYSKWKFIAIAAILTVSIFSMFDILLTAFEIWVYNPSRTTNIHLSKIPLEMVLYYLFLSLSFLLVFEFVKAYSIKRLPAKWANVVSILLFLGFSILTIMFLGKLYTSLVALLLSVFIFQFLLFVPRWLPTFYTTFAICSIPIFILEYFRVSLGLTIYSHIEKSGIDLLDVPVENLFYIFLFCLVNIFFYHIFMPRKLKRYAQHTVEETPSEKKE